MDGFEHRHEAGDRRTAANGQGDDPVRPLGRIVVLDGATLDPGDNPFDRLGAYGEVIVYPRSSGVEVAERAGGAVVLLTNKTVLDAATLESLPELRLVCVLATGVNVVDLVAAARRGITVCNVPGYSAPSVAQHVFAMLLQVSNEVALHADAVKTGKWAAQPDFSMALSPLVELSGRTMGIVGHGQIGSVVGSIAHAFGMKVKAFSPSRSCTAHYDGFEWADIDTVFATSDVVSLHCPLTPGNRRFVDARRLASMREGSILVNTARGDLVDEEALLAALDAGRPSRALLDVLAVEPPTAGNALLQHPRTVVTPHIAWATLAARRRLMDVTIANVAAFAEGRPQNVVA